MEMLRLTQPKMKGQSVLRLQELAGSLGFDCGRNDGIFGPKTEEMLKKLQAHLGLEADGICGPVTWKAIMKAVEEKTTRHEKEARAAGGLIVDVRGLHSPPVNFKKKRSWSEIRGVTLHQTGIKMSDKPSGWYSLNAHIGVTQDGKIILANDPTDFIWHAQGLSEFTIGIEISGNFYGIDGVKDTLWSGGGGPEHLNPRMIVAFDVLFDWLAAEFKKNKCAWKCVHAHRQSSNMRVSDPGSEIWQAVGMSWLKKLGKSATDGGPDFKLGSGKTIPREWNPAYSNNKF